MTRVLSLGFAVFVLAATLIGGCSSTESDLLTPETGIIVVETLPAGINSNWSVVGPNEFSQTGAAADSIFNVESGEYTITWGEILEWETPMVERRTLAQGKTITFVGEYIKLVGSVAIDPEPNSINAPWRLSGPDGYLAAGSGDMTLSDLAEGDYTLEWEDTLEWTRPNPDMVSQALTTGGSLSFLGHYSPAGFSRIYAGTFMMGSPDGELGRQSDETQRQVTLNTDLLLQTTEVTNGQYVNGAQWAYDNGYVAAAVSSLRDTTDGSSVELLDLDDPDCQIEFSNGLFTTDNPDRPVLEVTWFGAAAYCDWMSLQEGYPQAYDRITWACNSNNVYAASGYRLPTEAEWEYACRAGSGTAFSNIGEISGDITNINCGDPVLDVVGWYCGNAEGSTQDVAARWANDWRLYDMHGNLYEWCNDWYESYDVMAGVNPVGPVTGLGRVLRGGSWSCEAWACRSAVRHFGSPDNGSHNHGFRIVRLAD